MTGLAIPPTLVETPASQPANAPAPAGAELINLLLIDAPAGAGWHIQHILARVQPLPFRVEHADRLAAGLERARSGEFRVVLLALTLPDSQGLDTFLRLHHQAPGLPVVVLTDSQDEALGHIAVREGAQDCLVKEQVSSQQLAHALTHAISRHRLQTELLAQALWDTLTGLHNRFGFQPLAEQHWKLAYRTNRPFLLVVADVVEMRKINNQLGHRVGDAALRQAARIIQQSFRDSDILARLGGDEFVILVTEVPSDRGQGLVTRLQRNFSSYNHRAKASFELIIKVGTAYFDPAEPLSLETLMNSAYAAGQLGRAAG
jgi:two-component system, cell cycle response regulator